MSLPPRRPMGIHGASVLGECAVRPCKPSCGLLQTSTCAGRSRFSSRRRGEGNIACAFPHHEGPRRGPRRAAASVQPCWPKAVLVRRMVLALVLGTWAVSVSADPAKSEAHGSPGTAKPGDTEDRAWPIFMLGRHVRGPYARPVEVKIAPSCAKFGPQVGFSQVLGGESLTIAEAKLAFKQTTSRSLTSSANGTRAVLLMFHGGLGNTLMSAELGMWYAMLSGRRLLRFDFGPDKGGFEALCVAFKCNLASMPVVFDPKNDFTTLYDIPFERWADSLQNPKPLILNNRHSVPGLLQRRPDAFRCIADSLQCSSEADRWCMSAKQLNLLLPLPTDSIRRAIDRSMTLMPPNLQGEHPEHGPKQHWSNLTQHVQGETRHMDAAISEILKDGTPIRYHGKPLPDQKGLNSINLEFDVAVHVRTASRCVEEDPFSRGCRSADLSSAAAKAYLVPELTQFVQGADWFCMLSLVAFLAKQKMQRAPAKGEVPPFPWTRNEDQILRQIIKKLAPGPVAGHWAIGDSVKLAQELVYGPKGPPKEEKPQEPLRIFLATDSEALRPLFVEFLRPFGIVVHSDNLVAHVTRSKLTKEPEKPRPKAHTKPKPNRGKGHKMSDLWLWRWIHGKVQQKSSKVEPARKPRRSLVDTTAAALLDAKVDSLAEFYLLSKSSVIVGHGSRVSSFLQQAAMYGNTTLITKAKSGCDCPCCFIPGHFAEGQ